MEFQRRLLTSVHLESHRKCGKPRDGSQLGFSQTRTVFVAYIFLELIVRHARAADPVRNDTGSTCSSVSHLVQDPEILWCVELLCSVSDKHVGKDLA